MHVNTRMRSSSVLLCGLTLASGCTAIEPPSQDAGTDEMTELVATDMSRPALVDGGIARSPDLFRQDLLSRAPDLIGQDLVPGASVEPALGSVPAHLSTGFLAAGSCDLVIDHDKTLDST